MSARRALVVVWVLLAAAEPARADRDTAEAAAKAARQSPDATKAEALWRRAIAEDATFLPARLGLAETLLRGVEVDRGLDELRAFVQAAQADPAAATTWPDEVSRGRKRFADLEPAAAAVDAKVSKYVDAVLALATKWGSKDPDLARGLLQRVLRLQPGHAVATKRLEGFGAPVVGAGTERPLFDGKDRTGWNGIDPAWLTKGDGEIHASAPDGGTAGFTTAAFSGDFDFSVEMRVDERVKEPTMCGLMLLRGEADVTAFGFAEGIVVWSEQMRGEQHVPLRLDPATLDPAVDVTAWNLYEMRLRGDKAEAWLNGKKVGEVARREPNRTVQLGFRLQFMKVSFRTLQLRR